MIRKADLSLLDSDTELVRKINGWTKTAKPLHDQKIKHWAENEKWFRGEQWKNEKTEYQSDTVVNRIYPAIRNMVGMATDQRPKGDVLPAPADPDAKMQFPPSPQQMMAWQQAAMQAQALGQQPPPPPQPEEIPLSEVNKIKADKLHWLLDARWDELKMQEFVGKSFFHTFIYDDAYWMPFWNYRMDDFDVELVRPEDVLIDTSGHSIEAARFVIFQPWKNKKWIEENYPDKLPFIKFGDQSDPNKPESDADKNDERVQIQDIWTDYVRVLKVGDVILDKMANPLFEFRTDEEQLADWTKAGNDPQQFKPRKNYFKVPRKPLIMVPVLNVGEVYSESLMDQLKPVQRTMDKRKQQIDENANQTANAQWVYDINYLDKDEAAMLTNEPGLQIGIDGIEHIKKIGGEEMPAYVMRDMMHSQEIFDNLVGQHDISRGAKTMTQTATESSILSENDRVSVRALIRNYEYAIQSLYEFWLQMISLFYTDDKYVRVMGEHATEVWFTVNRFDVSDGINVRIVPGSTLPQDRASIRSDAVQLTQVGLLDPLTLYEVLDFPDPAKATRRLMAWRQGLYPDTSPQEMQQILMQRAQAQGNGGQLVPRQYINFKDVPPAVKEQMIAKAGMDMTPGQTSPQEQMQQQQQQPQGQPPQAPPPQ